MPPAPAARRSTWRSGWRGSGRRPGCSPGSRPTCSASGCRRCSRPRGSRRPTRSRPTGRRRSASSGSTPRGVPAYQFYDNGSADTGVTEADLPALGAGGVRAALRVLLAGRGAGRRRLRGAGRAASADRFVSVDPNVRPTVEPDMDVWRERLAVLFPLADLVKISAEDLELLRPGTAGRGAGRRPDRRRASRLVVVTDGGEAATGWTCGGLHATATPPRSRSSTPSAPATPSRRRCSRGCCATPGGPKAALAGLDADRARRDPRLRRAGRGHHLLAARRRPAAGRRADRLKDRPRWSQPSSPCSRSTW